ncbi:MAG: hypothetical protein ABW021_01605 [Acidimicrobiia bacterium]
MRADPLTVPELRAVAEDLAQSFETARDLGSLIPTGKFESHTSTFYELSALGDDAPTALIKVGGDWDQTEARRIYHDLVALSALLAENGSPLGVASPMGWHAAPPSICIEYVRGDDLGHLLRGANRDSAVEFGPVIEACGRALGAFHSQSPVADLVPDPASMRADIESMAKTVMLRPWFLEGVDLVDSTARRYGDFAPYNIRLDAGGRAWIIDQPSPPALEPVHRDVAWFLFNLERRLGWDTPDRGDALEEARGRLAESFHNGYRRTGVVALNTPADHALLALYRSHRSLWTARRRLRQREIGEVPAYLRLAVDWRKKAASPPG